MQVRRPGEEMPLDKEKMGKKYGKLWFLLSGFMVGCGQKLIFRIFWTFIRPISRKLYLRFYSYERYYLAVKQ